MENILIIQIVSMDNIQLIAYAVQKEVYNYMLFSNGDGRCL